MRQNYILSLFVAFVFFNNLNAQVSYTVNSIPFQPYTTQTVVVNTNDDWHSPVISLPFSFDFYGSTFNEITISTNGYITFNTNLANIPSPWAFSIPIPNSIFPVKHAILGAYHDMNNNNSSSTFNGSITYAVTGFPPQRKFVVYFYQNPLFSCVNLASSFQMVLHETTNYIDVILINVQGCPNWNGSNVVTGIINGDGTLGLAAPGRNTGPWSATNESWRFSRPINTQSYQYTVCDDDTDGLSSFSLDLIKNAINSGAPSTVFVYPTLTDAYNGTNALTGTSFTSTSSQQQIYTVNNGQVQQVKLRVVDCSIDYDHDTVPTSLEDPNNDGNLANDDTDSDGFLNYLDNDDDDDMVLTSVEYVFLRSTQNTLLDTDNDGIPNYIDDDDDGDGTITFYEDYNGDFDPTNDDTNANGIPDYLDNTVTLSNPNVALAGIYLFPNPVGETLNLQLRESIDIQSLEIYNSIGSLVKTIPLESNLTSVPVSDLAAGLYLVQVKTPIGTKALKFVKR